MRNPLSMRILLLTPPLKRRLHPHEQGTFHPVQGIAYVAANYRKYFPEDEIRLLDPRFQRYSLSQVMDLIEDYRPDIVGVSAMTHEALTAYALLRNIKTSFPEVLTVLGGAHITTTGDLPLKECGDIDIGLIGEGEVTFLELADALRRKNGFNAIKGIVYRDGNSLPVITQPREPVEDLNQIPFPAWDLYPRAEIYSIFASRGCPCRCIFCPRLTGDCVRYHSAERVIEELEYLVENFRPQEIHFNDDNFALDKKRAWEILDGIIRRNIHQRVRWLCNTRANLADYETFLRMKEAGCYLVSIGVESGNPQILKAIKKGITVEQAENAVSLAKKAGLKVATNFLIGFPYETRQTIKDTIDFMCKLNADHFNLGCVVPFPKTELAEMAQRKEGGLVLIARSWDDYDKVPGNALELKAIKRKDLERYVLKGYLQFFFRNRRFKDLWLFSLKFKQLVLHMLCRLR